MSELERLERRLRGLQREAGLGANQPYRTIILREIEQVKARRDALLQLDAEEVAPRRLPLERPSSPSLVAYPRRAPRFGE